MKADRRGSFAGLNSDLCLLGVPNIMKILKIAALIAAGGASFTADAITFTLTGSNTIGSVFPGTETPTAANANYINSLIFRSNNDTTTSPYDLAGTTYVLNFDSGTTLALADPNGLVDTGAVGGDDSVLVTGYEYLIVKYGGANGSSLVFNVSGITGEVGLPTTDTTGGNANKYLLFNAVAGQTNVPDGGATAALLGTGLLALGALGRKVNGAK